VVLEKYVIAFITFLSNSAEAGSIHIHIHAKQLPSNCCPWKHYHSVCGVFMVCV
jgi:hypothetical protein